ncbi:MAG: hypothetical protein N2037_05405 [Acidimicrobiales bacterium]|nr:hypothetical protein [Acidimicrobiales bacterium]
MSERAGEVPGLADRSATDPCLGRRQRRLSRDPATRSNATPFPRRQLAGLVAAAIIVSSVLSVTSCAGTRGNNDGPRLPGEENPAQPDRHRQSINERR